MFPLKRWIHTRGFTLIELLVVVAILGIIAAVGIPMLTGYIDDTKRAAAESSLRSIYLMEQDYKREEGEYYFTGSGNQTVTINNSLFSGNKTLDEAGDYYYYIRPYGSGYRAYAVAAGKSPMCIDHNNDYKPKGC